MFQDSDFNGYDQARLEAVIEEAQARYATTADSDYLALAHAAEVRLAQICGDGAGDDAAAEDAADSEDGRDMTCVFDNGARRIYAPADGTSVAVRGTQAADGEDLEIPGGEVNLNQ